jgi:hypothetical protein
LKSFCCVSLHFLACKTSEPVPLDRPIARWRNRRPFRTEMRADKIIRVPFLRPRRIQQRLGRVNQRNEAERAGRATLSIFLRLGRFLTAITVLAAHIHLGTTIRLWRKRHRAHGRRKESEQRNRNRAYRQHMKRCPHCALILAHNALALKELLRRHYPSPRGDAIAEYLSNSTD